MYDRVKYLFKYNTGVRIRVIDIVEEYAYLVNIDSVTSMHQKELISVLEAELNEEKSVLINDPFAKIFIDKGLSSTAVLQRDENWDFISKYYEEYKFELFEKNSRAKAFQEISLKSGINIQKVKRNLSRYWQRGMTKNAKGQERNLSTKKVGHPRKSDFNGEHTEGINITETVKKHFNIAINKYYRNTKQASLKEVYDLI